MAGSRTNGMPNALEVFDTLTTKAEPLVPLSATVAGETEQVADMGAPAQARATVPLNPSLGVTGDHVTPVTNGGSIGGFIEQRIVTAGKLSLAKQVAEREKAEIAKKYLIPRQLEESGLGDKGVSFTDDAVAAIISRPRWEFAMAYVMLNPRPPWR